MAPGCALAAADAVVFYTVQESGDVAGLRAGIRDTVIFSKMIPRGVVDARPSADSPTPPSSTGHVEVGLASTVP
jgi:hypothetical protein